MIVTMMMMTMTMTMTAMMMMTMMMIMTMIMMTLKYLYGNISNIVAPSFKNNRAVLWKPCVTRNRSVFFIAVTSKQGSISSLWKMIVTSQSLIVLVVIVVAISKSMFPNPMKRRLEFR